MLELQLAHVPVPYTSLLLNTPCLVLFRLDKTCVAKNSTNGDAWTIPCRPSSRNTARRCNCSDAWKTQQHQLFPLLSELDGTATLGGEGRANSPGPSAKYGTYTMMGLRLGKVIDVQLVQVTDRHRSIAKWLRDEKKSIKHYYDIWHITKGLGKKLDKLALQRDCGIIKEWKKFTINHLYWCAASTPDGVGAAMLAKWTSLSNHLLNRHTGHVDVLFPECLHDSIPTPERKTKWLTPGSKAEVLLQKILQDTWLLKDVQHLSPMEQTSSVEGFHSTILHFVPKHTAFQYMAMQGRRRTCREDGEKRLTVYFSKAKRGEPSVRWEKTPTTHAYRHDMISAVLTRIAEHKAALVESLRGHEVLPPLSAAMKDVDRAAAREQFGSYTRHAPGEPEVEPGWTAWKATMLTVTYTTDAKRLKRNHMYSGTFEERATQHPLVFLLSGVPRPRGARRVPAVTSGTLPRYATAVTSDGEPLLGSVAPHERAVDGYRFEPTVTDSESDDDDDDADRRANDAGIHSSPNNWTTRGPLSGLLPVFACVSGGRLVSGPFHAAVRLTCHYMCTSF
ncbi:hypothetical protein LSAT2_003041 [Lamellibrachia satsuma]|nr:hypothetical protein LSAT2_003041 [Lamellibrachia satsuma]